MNILRNVKRLVCLEVLFVPLYITGPDFQQEPAEVFEIIFFCKVIYCWH